MTSAAYRRAAGTEAGDSDSQLALEKVYWSAPLVAPVTPAVVTVTSTVPALCAGAWTVMELDETTVTLVPAVAPKSTVLPALKPEPVMVTVPPPAVGPRPGSRR